MELKLVTLPLPPSDNKRLIIHRYERRMVLSGQAREFKREADVLLKQQWPKDVMLVPTYSHQLHISAKAYVPNWRGDCSNYTKILKDVLTKIIYDDDKFVHIDYQDTEKDVENPRIELTVPIEPYSKAKAPKYKGKSRCSCSQPLLVQYGWPKWTPHHRTCPLYRKRLA